MRHDERELLPFLPGSIEVLGTPPSTESRVLVWTITLVFAAAAAWAGFAQVDTVVVATGELVPDGQLKLVQPLRTCTVAELHASDGQAVKAGKLLLTLNTEENDTQRASIVAAIGHAMADRARATELVQAARRAEPCSDSVSGAHSALHLNYGTRESGEWAAYRETSAGLEAQAALARANKLKAQRALAKTTALLPLVREHAGALALLLAKSAVARPDWLRAKEALTSLSHDQEIRAAELVEAEETLAVRMQAVEAHRSRTRAV
jgi:hemolysin D